MPENKTLPLSELWAKLESPAATDYIQAGGYGAAIETARQGGREVIRLLRNADLRALDGTGSPLYIDWRACQSSPAQPKYLICLADDPDPTAPVYRELLLRSPHLVIEGLICGALAVGADSAFIYIKKDDHELQSILERALTEALTEGFLGEDALLDIHLVLGDRSFLCGGQDFQVEYLEQVSADRGPADRGLGNGFFGWPTVIHDPETWANVPLVLANGAEWYRSLGRELSGTKLAYLHGSVINPGLYEVPMGTTLGEIYAQAGGSGEGLVFKALQLGGTSGGFVPGKLLELPLDFEVLAEAGLSMGSGGMEFLDDSTCMVARTLEITFGCVSGSCEQVEVCHTRLNKIKRLLAEIEEGRGTQTHMKSLTRLGAEFLSLDPLGTQRSVARPLVTAMTYFLYDFIHHIEQGVCATGSRRGLAVAPCQAACPAGIDIPSYIAMIGEGRYEEAVAMIRRDNPLPWICGMVCTHPCELACTRGEMDEPVSIMALKGFLAGTAMHSGGYPKPPREDLKEEKVAVVGSGPAGLAAAFFLALKGYPVTIFEALPLAGGEMAVGIPEYRLPSAVVQQEVDNILSLGVELRTGVRVGRDLEVEELREQGYKAIFLAVGAQEGIKLGIPGEVEYQPVTDALTFLRQVRLGRKTKPADKVVVVGGGNAAIDAARTCVRLGCEKVYIAYRRTRKEMPAWEEEIHQAEQEGVELHYLTIPRTIEGDNGRVIGMSCLKAELGEPDASGRRRPIPVLDSEFTLEVGAVIVAIGQRPDITCLSNKCTVGVSDRGRIMVDTETLQTDEPDIFSGGDVVTGPDTVVGAVGHGKWAARSIDAYLRGEEIPRGEPARTPRMKLDPPPEIDAGSRSGQKRSEMPLIDMELRTTTFKQVEQGFSEEVAKTEAARCLRCDLCVGCGICQMVCEEMGVRGLHLTATAEGRLAMTDFHRPARSCIGCGSCVESCPHKNIRIMDEGDHRRIVFCGTTTAHLELTTCESCGATLAPQAYLTFLRQMVDDEAHDKLTGKLCPVCARQKWAEGQIGDVLWFPPPE